MAYSNTFGGAAKDAADATANAADLDTQFDAIEADLALKANTAKVEPTGDTSAGDNAAAGYTAAEGLVLTGQGTTNDVTIKNDADAEVMGVLTGTTTADFKGLVNAATGFDGVLGGVTPAAVNATTLDVSGLTTVGANIVSDTDSTDDLGSTGVRWANVWADAGTFTDSVTLGSDAVYATTLDTPVASTSGTSVTFTGIPSWAKKVTVTFSGVSTSGTSRPLIRLGDSGGIETTGYLGSACIITTSVSTGTPTDGHGISNTWSGANVVHGSATFTLLDSTNHIWSGTSTLSASSSSTVYLGSSSKTLDTALTQLSITTTGGSDTFDAGSINILVE